MWIIGCDFHPGFQQIAGVDTESGVLLERCLGHGDQEAAEFYRGLRGAVRVGMEATGNSAWFERLLAELGQEMWMGDAAKIRASYVRKQKTDRRDAGHILRLMLEDRFPRVWVPSAAVRDQRQLLVHRHKLVGMRTQVKNELQHLALNQGVQRKQKLWSEKGRADLEGLELDAWAGRRRSDLLQLLEGLEEQIIPLDEAMGAVAWGNAQARLLMTHPGVGAVTALGFVLTIGEVGRFEHSNQVSSYLGLIPAERSSGGKQKLGAITKQGSSLMRMLLVEAGQTAARRDEELRRDYQRLKQRKCSAVAKVMVARKLAVRMYWILREQKSYAQLFSSHVGQPGSSCGRKPRPSA